MLIHSESLKSQNPLIVQNTQNDPYNSVKYSTHQQPIRYRFSEKWDYEDMKSSNIMQNSQPRIIRISEIRNNNFSLNSKNINETNMTNTILESDESPQNYKFQNNINKNDDQSKIISNNLKSENIKKNIELTHLNTNNSNRKYNNQPKISKSFQNKTFSKLNSSINTTTKSINPKPLTSTPSTIKPKSNLVTKLIKQISANNKNNIGLKKKINLRKVSDRLNNSKKFKSFKTENKNLFKINSLKRNQNDLLQNNLSLRSKHLEFDSDNKNKIEFDVKDSVTQNEENNIFSKFNHKENDSDNNGSKNDKDDIRSTGGKNTNTLSRTRSNNVEIKKIKHSILSSNLSLSDNSSNIAKPIKFSNPKSSNIKFNNFSSNDKNIISENNNQTTNTSRINNDKISEHNKNSLIQNISPESKLNPFTRKEDNFKISFLPDVGVESSEKEKEKNTNMVSDTEELYQICRKKTQYSKDVANHLDFLNKFRNTQERMSENRNLRNSEMRDPIRLSHSRVSIDHNLNEREFGSRPEPTSRILNYNYNPKQPKYIKTAIFEEIDELSETSKRSTIKNGSIVTENNNNKNIVKTSINLKLKKDVINNPTVNSQSIQDSNSLQTSVSTRNLKKPDYNIIQKSHSTININSSQSEKHINIYSSKVIETNVGSSQKKEKVFNFLNNKKTSSNQNNSIPNNPHLRRNIERRMTNYFEEQEKYFRPIYQDFGECPINMYRLVIFISEKNSKTDKIFFNNPTNFVEPKMLINFDMNNSANRYNTSKDLSKRLKCVHKHNFISAAPESLYYDMSQVVQSNKTLRPSMYHDIDQMEEDFSFPEDQQKKKTQTKPNSFGLSGATQIDEDTYELNGYQFKIQKQSKSNQRLSSSKSAQNLHTSSFIPNHTNHLNKSLINTRQDNQYKSYTNLPQRSYKTINNSITSSIIKPTIRRNIVSHVNTHSSTNDHLKSSQTFLRNKSKFINFIKYQILQCSIVRSLIVLEITTAV